MPRPLNTFQGNPISIERGRFGGYRLSAILDAGHASRLFSELYLGYPKREAISQFRNAIRNAR